ncbi:MAG: hypothetical protein U0586_17005, partial [Candidatus Brocadiaceae bacterium]
MNESYYNFIMKTPHEQKDCRRGILSGWFLTYTKEGKIASGKTPRNDILCVTHTAHCCCALYIVLCHYAWCLSLQIRTCHCE